MEKKNQEKLKTMLLFCLIFIGINYALYQYIIIPKQLQVSYAKQDYIISGETQNMSDASQLDLENIAKEVETLKHFEGDYDGRIMSKIDTIQITYDFYNFSRNNNIVSMAVQYNLTDLQQMAQEQMSMSTDETVSEGAVTTEIDPATPPEDEMLVTETEEVSKPYHTVAVTLDLQMEKDQLADFLKMLSSISKETLFLKSLKIEALAKDQLIGDITEEEVASDYLQIGLTFNAYVDSSALITDMYQSYTFYREADGYTDFADLFATDEETAVEIEEVVPEEIIEEPVKTVEAIKIELILVDPKTDEKTPLEVITVDPEAESVPIPIVEEVPVNESTESTERTTE